jgi:hypothetical protein
MANATIVQLMTYLTYYLLFSFNKKTINWQGVNWEVRSSYNTRPDNNRPLYFSNANVWVDGNNLLHMDITKDMDGKWRSAQICTYDTFSYGKYSFDVDGPVDEFDPTTVLAMYMLDAKSISSNSNEIDIELAKWSIDTPTRENLWYVIRGNTSIFRRTYNAKKFSINTNLTTHSFDWTKDYINFQSYTGTTNTPLQQIFAWNFTPPTTQVQDRVPQVSGRLCVSYRNHLGNIPFNKQPSSITVRNVIYKTTTPAKSFGKVNVPKYAPYPDVARLINQLEITIYKNIIPTFSKQFPVQFKPRSLMKQVQSSLIQLGVSGKLDLRSVMPQQLNNITQDVMQEVIKNVRMLTKNYTDYRRSPFSNNIQWQTTCQTVMSVA